MAYSDKSGQREVRRGTGEGRGRKGVDWIKVDSSYVMEMSLVEAIGPSGELEIAALMAQRLRTLNEQGSPEGA